MSAANARLPQRPMDRVGGAFTRFIHVEAMAGGALVLCALVALAASNSPWSQPYRAFREARRESGSSAATMACGASTTCANP